jgi:hypothetical protein
MLVQSRWHLIHVDPVHVAPLYIDFIGCASLPRQQLDLYTLLTSANSPLLSIFRRFQGHALHHALHYTLQHTLHQVLHCVFHHILHLCTFYSWPPVKLVWLMFRSEGHIRFVLLKAKHFLTFKVRVTSAKFICSLHLCHSNIQCLGISRPLSQRWTIRSINSFFPGPVPA